MNGEPIQITREQRQEVVRIVCQRLQLAIAGCEERDGILAMLDDQLEGIAPTLARRPWRGSCDLVDPLTQESVLQVLAMLTQASRRDPKVLVEAIDSADKEQARQYETMLTDLGYEADENKVIYDLAYNALRDPTAVIYRGWKEQIRLRQATMFEINGVTHRQDEIPAEHLDDLGRINPKTVQTTQIDEELLEYSGLDMRAVDLFDIYTYPPNAQDIDKCIAIHERRMMSEDDLLEGVALWGYDIEAVNELIRRGPTATVNSSGEFVQTKDTDDGRTSEVLDPADGFYECFLVFTKLPKLRDMDGRPTIREEYLHHDAMMMVCLDHEIAFKMVVSPFDTRPYEITSLIPKPGRMEGKGLCQLIQPLQEEATANLRFTIDSMNVAMAPVLLVSEAFVKKYGNWKLYPGAMLPQTSPGEIAPLPMNTNSIAGLQLQQAILGRAQNLVSAQGYGELNNKVRKATEIQAVMAATSAKFDLFLTNFNMFLPNLAAAKLSLALKYRQGQDVTIAELKRKFRFIPNASSLTATPEARQQLSQATLQLVRTSPLYAAAVQSGDMRMEYALLRQALLDMGQRSPETIIGQEPAPPQIATGMQAGMGQPEMGGMPEGGGVSPFAAQMMLEALQNAGRNGAGAVGGVAA